MNEKRIRDKTFTICRTIDTEFHNRILNKYSFLRKSGYFPALVFKKAYAGRTNKVRRGYHYYTSLRNILYTCLSFSLVYPLTLKLKTVMLDFLNNQVSTHSLPAFPERHPTDRTLPVLLSGNKFTLFLHAHPGSDSLYLTVAKKHHLRAGGPAGRALSAIPSGDIPHGNCPWVVSVVRDRKRQKNKKRTRLAHTEDGLFPVFQQPPLPLYATLRSNFLHPLKTANNQVLISNSENITSHQKITILKSRQTPEGKNISSGAGRALSAILSGDIPHGISTARGSCPLSVTVKDTQQKRTRLTHTEDGLFPVFRQPPLLRLCSPKENRVGNRGITTSRPKETPEEPTTLPFSMRNFTLTQRFFTNILLKTLEVKNSLKPPTPGGYPATADRQAKDIIEKDSEGINYSYHAFSERRFADRIPPVLLSGNKSTFLFKKNTRTTNLNFVYRDSSFKLTTPEILFLNNTERFQKEIHETRKVVLETRKELQEKVMSRHSIKEEIEHYVNNRFDINRIVDQVYSELTRRIRLARERRGFYA